MAAQNRAQDNDHSTSKHSTLKSEKINAGKDSYLDLVVITLLLAACLPFLVITPTINMTSTVPTENKIVNGIGLLIVVLLLVWSLVFRILWAIPRCKQRCYVSEDEDKGLNPPKPPEPDDDTTTTTTTTTTTATHITNTERDRLAASIIDIAFWYTHTHTHTHARARARACNYQQVANMYISAR